MKPIIIRGIVRQETHKVFDEREDDYELVSNTWIESLIKKEDQRHGHRNRLPPVYWLNGLFKELRGRIVTVIVIAEEEDEDTQIPYSG